MENSNEHGAATALLIASGAGDHGARERMLPLIYDELRSLAAEYLRVMLAAERDWLRTTIDRLETKDLPWPRRTKS